jgi:hypothetical protein
MQLLPVVLLYIAAVVRDGTGIRALTCAEVVDNPMCLVDLGVDGHQVVASALVESVDRFVFFDVAETGRVLVR